MYQLSQILKESMLTSLEGEETSIGKIKSIKLKSEKEAWIFIGKDYTDETGKARTKVNTLIYKHTKRTEALLRETTPIKFAFEVTKLDAQVFIKIVRTINPYSQIDYSWFNLVKPKTNKLTTYF